MSHKLQSLRAMLSVSWKFCRSFGPKHFSRVGRVTDHGTSKNLARIVLIGLAAILPPGMAAADVDELFGFHLDFATMAAHGINFDHPEIICIVPVDLPSTEKGIFKIVILGNKGGGAQVWAVVDFPLSNLQSLWTGGEFNVDTANPQTSEWGWMYDRNDDGDVDWVAYVDGTAPVLPKQGLPDGFPNLSTGEARLTGYQLQFLEKNARVIYHHIVDADFDQQPDHVVEVPISEANGWGEGAMAFSIAGDEPFTCTWRSDYDQDEQRPCAAQNGVFVTKGDGPVRSRKPPLDTLALYWLVVRAAAGACDFGPSGIAQRP